MKTISLYINRELEATKEVKSEREAFNEFRSTIEKFSDMFIFRLEFQEIWEKGEGEIMVGGCYSDRIIRLS